MNTELFNEKKALAGLWKKVQSGQFFHAVIFDGRDASLAASEYACACVCAQEAPPCGKCIGCEKAKKNIHPDIYIAEGSGASHSISVETIRFIREDAYKKANEAPRKVYLLQNAEDMTPAAQNALLKILEDPPANVVFILVCTNARDLLPTVLSRCQLYSVQSAVEDPEALEYAEQFAKKLIDANEIDFLSLSAPLISDKTLFIRMIAQLITLLHGTLLYRTCGKNKSSVEEQLGDTLTENQIFRLYSLTDKTREKAENKQLSLNQSLLVTSYFAAARAIRYGSSI